MRRNERRCVALVFAIVACIAHAEVRLVNVEFLPSIFSAGTRVQVFARLEVSGQALAEGALDGVAAKAARVPGSLEPTVQEAFLKKDGDFYLYMITFTPWQPGEGFLPSLTAGTARLPAIPFVAASALEGDSSLPPPRPQRELPGMRLRVYVFAGLLLALVLGVIFSLVFLPGLVARFLRGLGVARARQAFLQVLAGLEKRGDAGPFAWAALCGALRAYLAFRLAAEEGGSSVLMSRTAREFSRLPSDSIPGGIHGSVAAILLRGDMVRWAGAEDGGVLQAALEAKACAEKLDAALLEAEKAAREKPARGKAS